MTSIVFVSDTHVGVGLPHGRVTPDGWSDRTTDTLDALRHAFRVATEVEAVAVIHAGDLFDTPRPRPAVLLAVKAALAECPCPLLLVPGNHDTDPRSRVAVTDVLTQWTDPLLWGGVEVLPIPWAPEAEINKSLLGLPARAGRVIVTHGMVRGTQVGSHRVGKGIEPELLGRASDLALLGHVHTPTDIMWDGSRVGAYIGSPMAFRFGSPPARRGCRVLDLLTMELTTHPFPGPRMVTVEVDRRTDPSGLIAPAEGGYIRLRGAAEEVDRVAVELRGWRKVIREGSSTPAPEIPRERVRETMDLRRVVGEPPDHLRVHVDRLLGEM